MDYYQILQLNREASAEDIRRAYKRLAMIYHPDRGATGCEDVFKQVAEAYAVLGDETQRNAYDATLSDVSSTQEDNSPLASIFPIFTAYMDAWLSAMTANTRNNKRVRVVRLTVTLEEFHAASIKKVVYKSSIHTGERPCTLYVQLFVQKRYAGPALPLEIYTFPGNADIQVHVTISPHPRVRRSPGNTADLCITEYISLYEYYYGLEKTVPWLGGETLALQWPGGEGIQELPDYGLPYKTDDEELAYGSLHVEYKLRLPAMLHSEEFQACLKNYFGPSE